MAESIQRRPTLLIAEDDRALAETMRDGLDEDFDIGVAKDGDEAVALVRDTCPDVLVMDARMPRMDGIEACRTLRLDPRTANLSIIMVTGGCEPSLARAAFDAGATDYLTKPFSMSQLRARAQTCLLRRRAV
jgi:two-component system phosphate regulon response regulator PhoB